MGASSVEELMLRGTLADAQASAGSGDGDGDGDG